MLRREIPSELIELCLHDPWVHSGISAYLYGGFSLEQALTAIVCAQAKMLAAMREAQSVSFAKIQPFTITTEDLMTHEPTPTESTPAPESTMVQLIGIERCVPEIKPGQPQVVRWMLVVSPGGIAFVEKMIMEAAGAFGKELRQRTGAA